MNKLKKYFDETPAAQIKKGWDSLMEWDSVGLLASEFTRKLNRDRIMNIREAAKKADDLFSDSLSDAEIDAMTMSDNFIEGFKVGWYLAQKWILITDDLPEYYSPVIAVFIINDIEHPISVWRAYSDVGRSDIYTILGTNLIIENPIKWRYL